MMVALFVIGAFIPRRSCKRPGFSALNHYNIQDPPFLSLHRLLQTSTTDDLLAGTDKVQTAEETIRYAYENGVNFFDCADAYSGGEVEKFLGRVLKNYRRSSLKEWKNFSIPDEFYLTSYPSLIILW